MEQRMIDHEKLNTYLILCAEECKSRARKHAERECFAYAGNAERQADFYIQLKDNLDNADIYADPQPEPKWHYEDIDSWEAFEEYAGQEVEWHSGYSDEWKEGILRGYLVGSDYPSMIEITGRDDYAWQQAKCARVKVYDS